MTRPPDATPTTMIASRRRFLRRSGIAIAAGSAAPAWLLGGCAPTWQLRTARSTSHDVPRFDLGIASGHPGATRVVLWTRLTGGDLPERVEVNWELAHDEAFQRIAARGVETAEAAWAHSVHAEPSGLEPGRWYWYRFQALGDRSAVGRTRTAPSADARSGGATPLRFAIASCQRYDAGHYAAWRDVAEQKLDLVLFLGDYIYESGSRPDSLRRHEGGAARTLDEYRARYATYKRDPLLQAAHASAPWLTVWDDHEVENDYAGLQGPHFDADFAARRASAYQAYWEHLPFPKSVRPTLGMPGADMRITGRLDWGTLARIHLLDDRQYRAPQACPRPGQGGSNTVARRDCPDLLDPGRSLLGLDQERWLADGWDLRRPWNLVAQQTLMARHSWTDPASETQGTYWTDGWDGYVASRNRLLGGVAERQVPGVVVLGGDVHSHVVADLKADFDRPEAATVATEFCGTSITSHGMPQDRIDAARPFNPHIQLSRSNQRGCMLFTLDAKRLEVSLRVVDEVSDPASAVRTRAEFVVQAGRPGAVAA
ncbi:MAG: alkaline phosphatase D family protein [Burkholderiaceae bacterium]|nr:alkaline phosphatase D family protein [Burkholderiaceae bacterium]